MQSLEGICLRLRHSPLLKSSKWLWTLLRPVYDLVITVAGRKGLVRIVNGSDPILVSPRFRHVTDVYEPEVWHTLMSHVLLGDIAVDVGAYIGLYTVALAKRVGHLGKVVAFEPDRSSFVALTEHVQLNGLTGHVQLVEAVVGNRDCRVRFQEGRQSQSHVAKDESGNSFTRESVTLDKFFADQRVNILKIDVEGYELEVLQGARTLLQDPSRCPRIVSIEVHPYAWPDIEKGSAGLLQILRDSNYRVVTTEIIPVTNIERYGEILAIKRGEL